MVEAALASLSSAGACKLLQRGISSQAIGPLGNYLGLGKGVIAESLDLDRSTANRKAATQALSLSWLAFAYSLGLWVPSFIEPSELNLLINPAHPD